ncbi:hypothetical protein GUITHDRAFT_141766 [Guillardia theta CCMP2712]|uniref:Uncharacterized protein n=1 Tax=Guillardia theta (strain CCMP2712) TaxID=905079 RepID=L1J133_GUITC|nr:hypothetical protein GUITHDRAFT_141766 [Guillardia theta CCMP2712]EKX41775.1 hypothetical protein GUITHDRAFT_141766 [Guillardia theta CCMP2712]|eukprot:XP_005828755.1 hypothetical protein GUITHDRAFT_141766 [Guillardia theta CCMP2712]
MTEGDPTPETVVVHDLRKRKIVSTEEGRRRKTLKSSPARDVDAGEDERARDDYEKTARALFPSPLRPSKLTIDEHFSCKKPPRAMSTVRTKKEEQGNHGPARGSLQQELGDAATRRPEEATAPRDILRESARTTSPTEQMNHTATDVRNITSEEAAEAIADVPCASRTSQAESSRTFWLSMFLFAAVFFLYLSTIARMLEKATWLFAIAPLALLLSCYHNTLVLSAVDYKALLNDLGGFFVLLGSLRLMRTLSVRPGY